MCDLTALMASLDADVVTEPFSDEDFESLDQWLEEAFEIDPPEDYYDEEYYEDYDDDFEDAYVGPTYMEYDD